MAGMDDEDFAEARERLKALMPEADCIAMIRAREAGDEALHGDLMAPYLESGALMMALHMYTESFCRAVLGRFRQEAPHFDVDGWLEHFTWTIAEEGGLPPVPPDES